MTQWAPFLAVVAVLTVLLLVLSRQSQAFIRAHAESDTDDPGDASGRQAPVDAGDDSLEATETSGDAGDDLSGPEDSPEDTGGGLDGTESDDSAVDDTQAATAESRAAPEAAKEPATESSQDIELTSGMLLANVASTQALFAGVVLVAAWYFSVPAEAFGVTSGPLAGGPVGVGVGLAFGLVLWLANELSTTVADAAGAAYDETVRELLAPDSTRGWVGLFVVVLPLIAVAEELLFRGALIGVPAAGFDVSPWLLAVVASLAFALGHGAQGRVGIVVTGVLGLALAAGYIVTDSLLVVVVAHYVINAAEFLRYEYLGIEVLSSRSVPWG